MTDPRRETVAKAMYVAWCGYDPDEEHWTMFVGADGGAEVREGYLDMADAALAVIDETAGMAVREEDVDDVLTMLDEDMPGFAAAYKDSYKRDSIRSILQIVISDIAARKAVS